VPCDGSSQKSVGSVGKLDSGTVNDALLRTKISSGYLVKTSVLCTPEGDDLLKGNEGDADDASELETAQIGQNVHGCPIPIICYVQYCTVHTYGMTRQS
jgi:hypothetical protein